MMRGGPRGPMMMMMEVMRQADADKDGKVTQEEIDALITAKVELGDTDGDGAITLEEFKTFYLDLMARQIVDRFQAMDEDGDGRISAEERDEKFAGVVEKMDRNGDGALSRDDGPRGRHGHGGARAGKRGGGRDHAEYRHGPRHHRMRGDDCGPRGERGGPRFERGPRGERPEMPGAPDMPASPQDDAPAAAE